MSRLPSDQHTQPQATLRKSERNQTIASNYALDIPLYILEASTAARLALEVVNDGS
jgi:hypothetical protein